MKKRNSRRPKAGTKWYFIPGPGNNATTWARITFLQAVRHFRMDILESLKAELFTAFKASYGLLHNAMLPVITAENERGVLNTMGITDEVIDSAFKECQKVALAYNGRTMTKIEIIANLYNRSISTLSQNTTPGNDEQEASETSTPYAKDRVYHWNLLNATVDRYYPEFAHIRDDIQRWATVWHLTDPWMLNIIVRTLEFWSTDQNALDQLLWKEPSFYTLLDTTELERPFKFEHGGWSVKHTATREEAEAIITQAFKFRLDHYLDQMENMFRDKGLEQPRENRKIEHFEWLVEFQFHNRFSNTDKLEELAKENNHPVRHVRSVIKEKADLIGLTLRRDKAGRKWLGL